MTTPSGLSQIYFNVFESIYKLLNYFGIFKLVQTLQVPFLSLAEPQSLL